MKNLFKDFFTVPNMLSVFRIILIPFFIVLFLNHNLFGAVIVLALSGLSDCLDGKIARRFNQITDIGKLLDPVADKLTQASIAIVLMFTYPQLIWLLAIFIIKELIMIIGASYMLAKGKRPMASEIWGKLATTVFYGVMLVVVAFGKNGLFKAYQLSNTVIMILIIISAVFTVIALISYIPGFMKAMSEKDTKD